MPNIQTASSFTSNRNRPTHRKLANTILHPGESAADFAQLVNSLIDDLQPGTPIEHLLIEKMAFAQWRQSRVRSSSNAAPRHPDLPDPRPDAPEMRFERQFIRALNTLLKLRRFRDSEQKSKNITIQPWI